MLKTLKNRFHENMKRHPDLKWEEVEKRLQDHPKMLEILKQMEESGGEPDVIGTDADSGKLVFCDCSKETPSGRRSLCYDEEALQKRSKNPPAGSALTQAQEMGVELMDEKMYYRLQELGEFDLKTSSWIDTPADVRDKGGALFCERRYGRVFTFHNGADSYYSVRGWRGYICL
ncbi:MAG: DUF4256 domain-containing protein [Erysipelotrichaceae bacterium]|nr:DUF4256 domain-containing protein [Erysipelotrichaceae bacterium]MBQ1533830.1 DUF4256 domain-containing protein [Erysipelotrichaceae bacterium]